LPQRQWVVRGRDKGDVKFVEKEERVEVVGDLIGRMMMWETVKCKACC
jgi:hypothetical protein